jgi:hypothetical protein
VPEPTAPQRAGETSLTFGNIYLFKVAKLMKFAMTCEQLRYLRQGGVQHSKRHVGTYCLRYRSGCWK